MSKKLLYVASTASHLRRFHMPYIRALREEADVRLMATGDPEFLDFDLPFEKSMFSASNLKTICRIRKILRREKFDAVILNTSLAAFLVRAAMIGMRHRPYVHNVVHGYLFDEPIGSGKERILKLCERILRRQTDTVTVMNEIDLKIATKNRFCRGDVAFCYGMGVDLPTDRPTPNVALRAQYANLNEWLCTFVGELSGRKNQTFLINAIAEMRRRGLPVKLLLVGEGAARPELEAQIRELALEEAVFLLGNREPVLPYLAISDLYLSASRIEGLPFNIMEAMAMGLPIVASDAKGQTDLLADLPSAIYPRGDMDALIAAVNAKIGAGERGVGAVEYPALARYRLDAVREENLELLKKGWN
jgi:glycosyltransferase EpsD